MNSEGEGRFSPKGPLALVKLEAEEPADTVAINSDYPSSEIEECQRELQIPVKRMRVNVDKKEEKDDDDIMILQGSTDDDIVILEQNTHDDIVTIEKKEDDEDIIILNDKSKNLAEDSPENQNTFAQLNSLPASVAAFSIELVREKIFADLTWTDIKNTRLISRAMQYISTDKTFFNNCITLKKNQERERFEFWQKQQHSSPKTLWQLTELMDGTGTNLFPCDSFTILDVKFKDKSPDLKQFLNRQGFRIKKLDLVLDVASEADLLTFVTNLILEQTPNLVELTLTVVCSDIEKLKSEQLSIKCENESKKCNFNLQNVTLKGINPNSLMECIIKLAPNINELNTDNLKYYTDYRERLRLCRRIYYCPPANRVRDKFNKRDPLEDIVNIETRLKIKELELLLKKMKIGLAVDDEPYGDRIRSRLRLLADIVNKLLDKCKYTLENLILDDIRFAYGLKIPKMLNVKYIKLTSPPSNGCFWSGSFRHRYFPKTTRVSECFPNLRTIAVQSLMELTEYDDLNLAGSNEDGSDDQILCSVKLIKAVEIRMNPENVDLLLHWFPNASIEEIHLKTGLFL